MSLFTEHEKLYFTKKSTHQKCCLEIILIFSTQITLSFCVECLENWCIDLLGFISSNYCMVGKARRSNQENAGAFGNVSSTSWRIEGSYWCKSGSENQYSGMGRACIHGSAIWIPGAFNMVGILMGYHGTCHLFCHIRIKYCHVRIFCPDKRGTSLFDCPFFISESDSLWYVKKQVYLFLWFGDVVYAGCSLLINSIWFCRLEFNSTSTRWELAALWEFRLDNCTMFCDQCSYAPVEHLFF